MPYTQLDPRGSGLLSQTPAEAFLEGVQERIYTSLGVSAESVQWKELVGQQAVIPARLQQMQVSLPPTEFERYRLALFEGLARDERTPRPTRFERPHQYAILRDLKTSIERAARRLGLAIPVTPVLGTLPTQLLEPLMLLVPETQEVVLVVDGQVLTYVNQLSKAVAQAMPFGFEEDDEFLVAPDPATWRDDRLPSTAAVRRFSELMVASIQGSPTQAPHYALDAEFEPVAGELCDCMELFIVGREYARLAGGDHLAAPHREHLLHGESLHALSWTVEQEANADALGLALAMTAAAERGNAITWAFVAVDALLASYSALEGATRIVTAKRPERALVNVASVHEERRLLLRQVLEQWDGGAQVIAFADALAPSFEALRSGLEATVCDICWGRGTLN
ncbi:MAG: hypothetical protein JNM38_13925 [Acidobacteria bacterium]|nr:hypothetical protein [Acidobacteriota bacterium]